MSRRSGVLDVARTVTSAVRRADDVRRGRLPMIAGPADASSSVFLRGVAIGALVGAAIAGSTIWERRKARDRIRRELNPEARDRETSASPSPSARRGALGHALPDVESSGDL